MTRRGGFTIVELLIVVCIIGLLAGFAVPRVLRAKSKAQAADAVSAMRAVRIGVTVFFDSAGAWPGDGSPGVIPSGLAGYLPNNNPFSGKGWSLTWRQIEVSSGAGTTMVGAVQLNAAEPEICPAASILLGGPSEEVSVLCGPAMGTVLQIIER